MGLEKPVMSGTSGGNKVKKVQRGLVSSGTKNGNEVTITLSGFSNVNKMTASVVGDCHPNNSSVYSSVWVKSLTATALVVGVTSADYISASYEVVEFD